MLNRSLPKSSRYSRLADCRPSLDQKASNHKASQKRLRDFRDWTPGKMTGKRMRSQPILTFNSKIPKHLGMSKAKPKISPFLPLHPIQPEGRKRLDFWPCKTNFLSINIKGTFRANFGAPSPKRQSGLCTNFRLNSACRNS